MSKLTRIAGIALFLTLVVLLWYLSEFWPWRTLCAEDGPFGIGWLSALAEPLCSRDGIWGIEALDRRGGIIQRQLQALGMGEFGVPVWGLLAFLILSLTQVVWRRIFSLGGGEE